MLLANKKGWLAFAECTKDTHKGGWAMSERSVFPLSWLFQDPSQLKGRFYMRDKYFKQQYLPPDFILLYILGK